MPHVVAVYKLIIMTKSKVVRSFQYHSFHGECYRDVEKKIHTRVSYDDEAIAPLHVVRDGNHVPPITQPSLNFVVNAQIKALLEPLPNLRFEQVVFDKIVDFYYAKGDFTIYRNAERFDVRELQRARPDVPKLHAKIGSHYELVSPSHSDIVHEFPEATSVGFGEYGRELSPNETPLQLCERMVAEYPIQRIPGWHILSPAVFAVLKPYLDFDFYRTEQIEY